MINLFFSKVTSDFLPRRAFAVVQTAFGTFQHAAVTRAGSIHLNIDSVDTKVISVLVSD